MKSIFFIFLVSFFTVQNNLEAQAIFDSSLWKESICIGGKFSIKVPPIYTVKNECGIFYREENGRKTFPLHPFSREFYPGHDYLMKNDPETYNDWIEFQARLLYSGDGPGESSYGDSIAKNIMFKNRNGIVSNELYVYVSYTKYDQGRTIKTSVIKGPVYVFKNHQNLSDNELTLFFQLREDQCDSTDRKLVSLMFDSFNWIKK